LRPYELMTILAPDVPEDELTPTLDAIGAYITATGGEIVHISRESPWGRRRLAYSIRYAGRDVRDGFYTLWYFDAEPQAIANIERELRLNDRVIRYLTIALEKQYVHIIEEPPVEETAGVAADGEATADAPSEASGEIAAAEETEAVADVVAETEAEVEVAEEVEAEAATEVEAEAGVAGEADIPDAEAEAIDAEVATEPEDAAKE
jgi:small subunit ribosomal protein S6